MGNIKQTFIKKIDTTIRKVGLQKFLINLLKGSASNIVIRIHGQTQKVLKDKPVILISNHPNEFDPVILIASLPIRKDLFIIFTHIFAGISREFDKQIIPVFVQHDTKQTIPGKKFFLKLIHNYPTYSPNEEHKKNILSIKDASKKISDGGLVIITPSGRSKKGKWYSGIGYLIKNITKNKPVYIIYVHIQGTSRFDFLRVFPNGGRILPRIILSFSKAKTIEEMSNYDPKIITKMLEAEYRTWVQSLKNPYT